MRARLSIALALLAGLFHSATAFAQIQLVPVATGLVDPVFITGARAGTRRLFIVEQAGTIRLMPIDGGAMSLFLDIRSRVRSGASAVCSASHFIRPTRAIAASLSTTRARPTARL